MTKLACVLAIVVVLWMSNRHMAYADPVVEPQAELRERIRMIHHRFAQGECPRFTDDFILADVALRADYPRRFSEYSGDLSGRLIGALATVPSTEPGISVEDLVRQCLRHQRPDGRFGNPELEFTPDSIGRDHMALLWGNGRMLVALLEFHASTPDPDVLDAARRLAGFLQTVGRECADPAVAKRVQDLGAAGMICLTNLAEGFVLLAQATGDATYLDAARDSISWLEPRGRQHSHGYLTTLRAVLMLQEATRDDALLEMVEDAYRDLVASPDYLVYGGVAEYFGGRGDRDEGCSEADFLRLSLQLWRLTGSHEYIDRAERCLLNHFFANQFDNGDFGHHVLFSKGFAPATGTGRAWWCCTMHALRAFRDVLDALVRVDDGTLRVDLFLDAAWSDGDVSLDMTRDLSQDTGPSFTVRVRNAPASETAIAIRQPFWAESMPVTVNGEPIPQTVEEGYVVLRRLWSDGDALEVTPTCLARIETREGKVLRLDEIPSAPVEGALFFGPWLLGVHEATDPFFFGEPWQDNAVILEERLVPDVGTTAAGLSIPAASFQVDYEHGGFPERCRATLRPVSERSRHGQSTVGVWLRYRREK